MRMNIEKEPSKFIKPSVPTPPTLRHYKTGLFDELINASVDVSIVLFFSSNTNQNPEFVTQLQQSLEKTLTRFYPLAGRHVDEICMVDCSDEGVEFIHAKVNIKLQDILANDGNVKFVDEFIPSRTGGTNPLLAIQVTMLECGGVALGVCASHKIADASTLCTFINEWAAMNREEKDYEFTRSGFNAPSLFPGRCVRSPALIIDDDISRKYTKKKISFSESAISNMKVKAITDGNINGHMSKVQLVSAIIWKAFIAVDQANKNTRNSVLIQPVNLRGKTASLIPKHSCGNLCVLSGTEAGIVETTNELANRLTDNVKKTISNLSKVDHNSEEGKSMVLSCGSVLGNVELINLVAVSSWCKIPFYEADFGFGNPTWIVPSGAVLDGAYLMDEPRGNGVDAYVHLKVKDVPYFEEALQYDFFST